MVRQRVFAGLVGILVTGFLVAGGTLTAAFAQDKFTACVSKKGKIKKLQAGTEPLKNCKGKQVQIMFPNTDKTDDLMEGVSDLDEKTGLLMAKDMQLMEGVSDLDEKTGLLMAKDTELMEGITDLDEKTGLLMEKDMELMEDIDELNNDVTSLNEDVTEIQAEISGPIAEALASLQAQIENIVASSLIGGDMDFFQQIGPGSETVFTGMFGSNTVSDETLVTQNIAAPGILTNLFVRSSAPGADNTLTVTLRTANLDTSLTCQITGDSESCFVTDDLCVQVNEGDLISLRVDYVVAGDPTEVFDVRWNSRFVENGTCPDAVL